MRESEVLRSDLLAGRSGKPVAFNPARLSDTWYLGFQGRLLKSLSGKTPTKMPGFGLKTGLDPGGSSVTPLNQGLVQNEGNLWVPSKAGTIAVGRMSFGTPKGADPKETMA